MRKVFGLSKELEDGISKTITTTKNNIGQLRYEIIPLSRIHFDADNPRKLAINISNLRDEIVESDQQFIQKKNEIEKLQSLSNSIKKVGVRHAIEVYKDGSDYKLISGERRILASILAGKDEIQARILDRKPNEFDLKLLQWIENIEREDLSPWEKINNVRQLVEAYLKNKEDKITGTMLSEIIGCSRQYASILISVLEAPVSITDFLKNGKINNLEKVAFLARTKNDALQTELLEACINGASLENLKRMTEKNKISNRKGRPITKINLGSTSNVFLVKKIINSVLSQNEYISYKNGFDAFCWNKPDDVCLAFKKLLKVMEIHEKQ